MEKIKSAPATNPKQKSGVKKILGLTSLVSALALSGCTDNSKEEKCTCEIELSFDKPSKEVNNIKFLYGSQNGECNFDSLLFDVESKLNQAREQDMHPFDLRNLKQTKVKKNILYHY